MLVRAHLPWREVKDAGESVASGFGIPDCDADVLQAKYSRDTFWSPEFPESRCWLNDLNTHTAQEIARYKEALACGCIRQVLIVQRYACVLNPPELRLDIV
jgi:hypothetical protein